MSNVSTSLNQHYVKKGRYYVHRILGERGVSIAHFSNKKDAISFCRQKFYEHIFDSFFSVEDFRSFAIPDGYSIIEDVFSDAVFSGSAKPIKEFDFVFMGSEPVSLFKYRVVFDDLSLVHLVISAMSFGLITELREV